MSPGEYFVIIIPPPQISSKKSKKKKKKKKNRVRHCVYPIHTTEISCMYVY